MFKPFQQQGNFAGGLINMLTIFKYTASLDAAQLSQMTNVTNNEASPKSTYQGHLFRSGVLHWIQISHVKNENGQIKI